MYIQNTVIMDEYGMLTQEAGANTADQAERPMRDVAVRRTSKKVTARTVLWYILTGAGMLYVGLALYVMLAVNEDAGAQMLLVPLGIVVVIAGTFLLYLAYLFISMLVYVGVKVLKYVVPAVLLYYFLKMVVTAYIQAL